MSALSKKTPDNMEYKRNLAVYDIERARAKIKLKRFDEAETILRVVLDTMVPIAEADPATTTYQYDVSTGHRLSAEVFFNQGKTAQAIESIDRAIAIVQRLSELNALRETDRTLLQELSKEKDTYQLATVKR